MSDDYSHAAYQAAAAAQNAHEIPEASLSGDYHGRCRACGARIEFEYGDDQHMSPCPKCGSNEWVREDDNEVFA